MERVLFEEAGGLTDGESPGEDLDFAMIQVDSRLDGVREPLGRVTGSSSGAMVPSGNFFTTIPERPW